MRFRRKSGPPEPEPGPRRTSTIEYLGMLPLPDLSGWWVYALCDRADGHVFYAGQSDHLLSRLRDHSYAFKDQFDPAAVLLLKVADQGEADLYELLLIRRYDPERNTVGRREELEASLRRASKPFKAGHRYSTREYLDSRQATD